MTIQEYVVFLRHALINQNTKISKQRWIQSGAHTKLSFDDFLLKLQGKETNQDKKQRLQNLDV